MMTTFPRLLLAATFLASADAFGYIIPPETTTTAAPAGAEAKVSTSLFMTGLSASDVNENADVRAALKATIISLGGYDDVSNIVAESTSTRRRLQDTALTIKISFVAIIYADSVEAAAALAAAATAKLIAAVELDEFIQELKAQGAKVSVSVSIIFEAAGVDKEKTVVAFAEATVTVEVVTAKPTPEPSAEPTDLPTDLPTAKPSAEPTDLPTDLPTAKPTDLPTAKPTDLPTAKPTDLPTGNPSAKPTDLPTAKPTDLPTGAPTVVLTVAPTSAPTTSDYSYDYGEAGDDDPIANGICASEWITDDGGTCGKTQYGCPSTPCDGDSDGPWCMDETLVNGALVNWFYCTP